MTTTMSPVPTVSPGGDLDSFTVPAFSAVMLFSIFMASSTQTGWPASTASPTATSTLTIVPCIGTVIVPQPAAPPPPHAGRARRAAGAAGTARPAAGAVAADSGTQTAPRSAAVDLDVDVAA